MQVMTLVRLLPVLALCAAVSPADVHGCACDASDAEKLAARECGLCREAEKQPPGTAVFFLKDINPRKPTRWLALPKAHVEGTQSLLGLTPEQRTEFWTASIAKARELFGDQWGIAMNGDDVRTQCHSHVHIGKLLEGVEVPEGLVVVNGPADIPVPTDGTGMWIHPEGNKLHVHTGEQITEKV